MKMAQSEVRDSEAMKIQDHQFAKRALRLKKATSRKYGH